MIRKLGIINLHNINRAQIINNKIKKIGLIHNAYPHEKSIFQKTLFKKYLKSINEYVTFSKNIKEEIIKISPFQKGVSLFHPVPEKFGNPIEKYIAKKKIGLENNIRYLLFFGLIREYKGLMSILSEIDDGFFFGHLVWDFYRP